MPIMSTNRGGLRVCGAPGWNLERGHFYIYKTVVNREKINERTEVFVLLKRKKLEKKKQIVKLYGRHSMNETHWFQISISCWRLETISIHVHKTLVQCFEYAVAPHRRPPRHHDRLNAVCRQLRPIHLRPFIWDHVHLRPRHLRPVYLRPHLYETCSFEATVIWDHIHLRPVHLRPHSFETTIIWDHIHLRPQYLRPHSFETTVIWDHSHLRPHLFETTVIWDHSHLRPHSFETTFISDHSHFRSHSFYAMSKWRCFNLLRITFLWSTFHFFAGLDVIC